MFVKTELDGMKFDAEIVIREWDEKESRWLPDMAGDLLPALQGKYLMQTEIVELWQDVDDYNADKFVEWLYGDIETFQEVTKIRQGRKPAEILMQVIYHG